MAPGVLRVGLSPRGRSQRRAKSSKRKAEGRELKAGEAGHARAVRQGRGMASRSPQPAGGHDPAWARRGSGVRPAGPRTPGSEAPAEPGEEGGPGRSRRPRRHSGDTWHFRFRLAALSPGGAAPRPPDSPESGPGEPCTDSPATSLTPAAHRKWQCGHYENSRRGERHLPDRSGI